MVAVVVAAAAAALATLLPPDAAAFLLPPVSTGDCSASVRAVASAALCDPGRALPPDLLPVLLAPPDAAAAGAAGAGCEPPPKPNQPADLAAVPGAGLVRANQPPDVAAAGAAAGEGAGAGAIPPLFFDGGGEGDGDTLRNPSMPAQAPKLGARLPSAVAVGLAAAAADARLPPEEPLAAAGDDEERGLVALPRGERATRGVGFFAVVFLPDADLGPADLSTGFLALVVVPLAAAAGVEDLRGVSAFFVERGVAARPAAGDEDDSRRADADAGAGCSGICVFGLGSGARRQGMRARFAARGKTSSDVL